MFEAEGHFPSSFLHWKMDDIDGYRISVQYQAIYYILTQFKEMFQPEICVEIEWYHDITTSKFAAIVEIHLNFDDLIRFFVDAYLWIYFHGCSTLLLFCKSKHFVMKGNNTRTCMRTVAMYEWKRIMQRSKTQEMANWLWRLCVRFIPFQAILSDVDHFYSILSWRIHREMIFIHANKTHAFRLSNQKKKSNWICPFIDVDVCVSVSNIFDVYHLGVCCVRVFFALFLFVFKTEYLMTGEESER